MAEIKATHPEARDLEVWFLDEARVGQTGRTCRRWFEKGIRPRGRRDLRHEAVYLFGAACPERDHGVALVLPEVSAAAMQAMLDACCAAWTRLRSEPGRIRSLCSFDWLTPVTT